MFLLSSPGYYFFFLLGYFSSLKYICKKRVFSAFGVFSILHFSFLQFLDFPSGKGLLMARKREETTDCYGLS